ncbi:molybdate ABC transporter substrate-binding protein [Gemmatimonadota bacterium Y43]|uniref:molybdate ABC transporter substrate-binding protein n=1 Tax=Gaopeijia maritima TaxID=3119007 RepID=UPI0032754F3D
MTANRPLSALLGATALSLHLACGGSPDAAPEGTDPDGSGGLDVAVAANFTEVAHRLAEAFTSSSGVEVRIAVGSTGGLTSQILSGAPYHLFLAADTLRPARLEAEGAAVPGSRLTYAVGRLAVLAPARTDAWELPGLLLEPGIRAAWADPRTAPYGAAAVEVLERWGLSHLEGAVATSVAQSWQFARSGAVDAAFVSLAQVAHDPPGEWREVPDSLHAPVRQQAVLLRAGENHPPALAFLALLRSAPARDWIRAAGYGLEESPDVD